jgi:two-component system response regulator (stage 0 sporulation protein F)
MSYVLVVDDEDPIRLVLRKRLERWGYSVKDASNAAEALELMAAEPAIIALLDIGMPGHDGLWLAERIRAQWTQTPIIMASGADDIKLVEKCRSLGAVAYVTKPFDKELLRQALLRAGQAAAAGE